jgi:predicted RNA-binding protein (virulence factor B family)
MRTPRPNNSESTSTEPQEAILSLGEVGFLEVTDIVPFGAFVDWGLPKELLVPLAEQTCEMKLGQSYAIGVIKDDQGRFTGTQRIAEMLQKPPPHSVDDWIPGEAWRREAGLGVFVILEKKYLGLLPDSEPHSLKRGDKTQFRIAQLLPDGKIQLSLRRKAFEELDSDAERVFSRLSQAYFRVSDDTSPEVIVARFGISKKAYKRAVGRLLKQGRVSLDPDGYVVLSKK